MTKETVKAEDTEGDGDRERLQMAVCWLAMCDDDDDDVMKWAPVRRAWMNCVCELCVCVCVCERVCLLHPLGFLGFVMQPNIPVHWLIDRNWVRRPPTSTPASFCHPQPPYHCQYPFPLYHYPKPLTSPSTSTASSSSWLTSEWIAELLGNPCLGPCYLDHLIMLPLEQSQRRYPRPVCILEFALHFFLPFVLSLQIPRQQ